MSADYQTIRAIALVLLTGAVLHARDPLGSGVVTAGRGTIVDWRTVPSGVTVAERLDAYDTAAMLVSLVGGEQAVLALPFVAEQAPPPAKIPPRVYAYALTSTGGRRRSFEVGPWMVYVEPNEDDEGQEAFTRRLAVVAAEVAS